ncbi:MAG: type II secretion system GspH family protein [Gammaproteobacteria bacterium]|nr:type II secretion system GspH family protein [Gammaproteobacteria bacterium]MBU1407882.1 type II secretion system GspH family protein [Gammaproteobacteria bacterium]MBU1531995.1 type II secretion system GspH family protein [Gammaproteobacteria bacterium]
MVELILVMVIAGILAAVAVPRMIGRNSFDTRGFADQLAATVRFAQKLAVAQGTDVFVQLTANEATLCYIPTTPCPAASRAPGPGGEKPYTVSAPGGVAIASPVAALRFDAGGRPDITAQLAIPVNGTGTHNVFVEQETGYVHD